MISVLVHYRIFRGITVTGSIDLVVFCVQNLVKILSFPHTRIPLARQKITGSFYPKNHPTLARIVLTDSWLHYI